MANSSQRNRTEIDRFTSKLQKQFGKIVTTTSMQMLGAEQVRQMMRVLDEFSMRAEQAIRSECRGTRADVDRGSRALFLLSPTTLIRRSHEIVHDTAARLRQAEKK